MEPESSYLRRIHGQAKQFLPGASDVHAALREVAVQEGIIRESLSEIAHDWDACRRLLLAVSLGPSRHQPQGEDYLRDEMDIRRCLICHIVDTPQWAELPAELMEKLIGALEALRKHYAHRALLVKRADWLLDSMKRRHGRTIELMALERALDVWLNHYEHDRTKRENYLAGIVRNVVDHWRKEQQRQKQEQAERKRSERRVEDQFKALLREVGAPLFLRRAASSCGVCGDSGQVAYVGDGLSGPQRCQTYCLLCERGRSALRSALAAGDKPFIPPWEFVIARSSAFRREKQETGEGAVDWERYESLSEDHPLRKVAAARKALMTRKGN